MAPDAEPDGEYNELGKQKPFQEFEGGVACSARGQDNQRHEGGYHAEQHRLVAVVCGGKGDRTPGGELAGDAGREIGGDIGPGDGFEDADDALIQMLDCGRRQVVLFYWFVVHVALLSCV